MELQEGRGGRELARKTSWKEITGADSVAEAETEVVSKLVDAIEEASGVEVALDPVVSQDLLALVKQTHMNRNKGLGDLDLAIEDVATAYAKRRMQLVPGPGDTVTTVSSAFPKTTFATDELGQPITGPDGRPQREELIPFAAEVYNPAAGVTENTLETWQRDRATLVDAFPVLGDEGGPGEIALDDRSALASRGIYVVKRGNGLPVIIPLGAEFRVGEETLTIPEDPDEARRVLVDAWTKRPEGDLAPVALAPSSAFVMDERVLADARERRANVDAHNRFRLIPVSGGLMLGYVPGFTETPLPTVAEREQIFDETNGIEHNRTPPAPVPIPQPTSPIEEGLY